MLLVLAWITADLGKARVEKEPADASVGDHRIEDLATRRVVVPSATFVSWNKKDMRSRMPAEPKPITREPTVS